MLQSARDEPGGPGASSSLSLASIGRRLWRQKYLIVLLTLLLTGAFAAVIWALPAHYVAEAQILIPSARNNSPFTRNASADPAITQETLRTELQLLQSDRLVKEVFQKLDLANVPELRAGSKGDDPTSIERAIFALSSRISISRLAESRIFRVRCWSYDPGLAPRVVNTLVELYLKSQLEMQASWIRGMELAIEAPLRDLQQRVRASEEALERERQEQGIIDVRETPLIVQQVITLTQQLAATRAARIEAESRGELAGAGATTRGEIAVHRAKEEALEHDLNKLKAEYERQNRALIRIRELERETAANRALLSSVLERYKQLQVESIIEMPNARVLFLAEKPTIPAAPWRSLLLVLAIILALGIAVLIAFVWDLVRLPNRTEALTRRRA
jgi:uncharacterized protein involved in exopolysaccharide biosynthesis